MSSPISRLTADGDACVSTRSPTLADHDHHRESESSAGAASEMTGPRDPSSPDPRLLRAHFDGRIATLLSKISPTIPASRSNRSEILRSLELGLLNRFFALAHKTLIGHYKLVEARMSFKDFCDALSDASVRDRIATTYPVLERQLETVGRFWLANTTALLRRFADDRDLLATELDHGFEAAVLCAIEVGAGDPHEDGASVSILRFNDGSRLVYKPRSFAVDEKFGAFVVWVNTSTDLGLRMPRHVSRPGYGWAEFIDQVDCDNTADVVQFYRKVGAFLFLLYLLEASDFHYENIIASGRDPVPVDLETFFHPTPRGGGGERTVLRTGLLPRRFEVADRTGPDISGLTNANGQEGLFAQMALTVAPDGRLAFERVKGRLAGGLNVPTIGGVPVQMSALHSTALKAGFEQVYRLCLSMPDAAGELIEAFADEEVRVLVRHTAAYSHLLDEARHPAILLSETHLARHLSRLGRHGTELDDQINAYEMDCLQKLDIPYFTVSTATTDLQFAGEQAAGFYLESGISVVRGNLANLSPEDLDRQLYVIEQALAGLRSSGTISEARHVDEGEMGQKSLPNRLGAISETIGERLAASMHQGRDGSSWLVSKASSLDGGEQTISSAGCDLYAGLPGEILFLTRLGRGRGDKWTELAGSAYRTFDRRFRDHQAEVRTLGLFTGWGGIIQFLALMKAESGDEGYDRKVEDILANVDFGRLIAQDTNYGLLAGSAGLIAAMSDYAVRTGSDRALMLAKTAARHLLQNRWTEGPGYSWRITSALPLSGLAHGASGFAVAFAKLFRASGDANDRVAALAALDYERTLYRDGEENWLDLRDFAVRGGGEAFSTTWAHGAPGIGLARLELLDCGIDEPQIRADLDVAVRTTLAAGLKGSPTLISGFLGALELPLRFAEQIGDQYWSETETLLSNAAADLEVRLPELPSNVSPFGLMTSLTGTAYQCLRIADNTAGPSLLSLSVDRPPHGLPFAVDPARREISPTHGQ